MWKSHETRTSSFGVRTQEGPGEPRRAQESAGELGVCSGPKFENWMLIWGYDLLNNPKLQSYLLPLGVCSGQHLQQFTNIFGLGIRFGQDLKTSQNIYSIWGYDLVNISKLNFAFGVRAQENPGEPRRAHESAGEPRGEGKRRAKGSSKRTYALWQAQEVGSGPNFEISKLNFAWWVRPQEGPRRRAQGAQERPLKCPGERKRAQGCSDTCRYLQIASDSCRLRQGSR